MTALTQRRRERESEEVAFQEVERPAIDDRLDRLASSARSLAATANKLLNITNHRTEIR